MSVKESFVKVLKLFLPLVLGGGILYWMYRDFDFDNILSVMRNEMNWTWMLLSLPFGVLAQSMRGLRWRQSLVPIGENPRLVTCVDSVYLSYAASLVVPRIGEFTRCGVLNRKDGVSFVKALGTVVTERIIDSILVLFVTLSVLLVQMKVFGVFFTKTGTRMDVLLGQFSTTGWLVTILCGMAVLYLLYIIIMRLSVYDRFKLTLSSMWQGISSLKKVNNKPLFLFYTLGIWVSYFLHYYLTFFCFDFTANLGIGCVLVTFVVGSIAVIVPTPNGAGPWHFAVKTMLILYGVADEKALYFVLIVHTLQTMLVIFMGIYSLMSLSLRATVKRIE